jgi:plastocyanin
MRFARLAATGLLAIAASCGGSSVTDTGNPPPPPPPPPGGSNISVKEYSFSPESVTVKVGAAVRWINDGTMAHHVKSDDNVWDAGNLAPPTGDGGTYGGTAGQSYQYTFTQAGTYKYHCENHPPSAYPNFTGVIVVTP